MGRNSLMQYIKTELNKFLKDKNAQNDSWEKGRAFGLLEIKKKLDKPRQ